MLKAKVEIAQQKKQIASPVSDDEVSVVIKNKGKSHCYSLPAYSELVVKVSDGKVQLVEITEKHKI